MARRFYCASLLEKVDGLKSTFVRLLSMMSPNPTLQMTAPASVEVTLFHQPNRGRYVLSLLNFQKDLPNIPIHDIEIRLRLTQPIRRIETVPSGASVAHRIELDQAVLVVPRLNTLVVLAISV